MILNYITIALRTIWKRKLFNTISIVGLAIGISAALVIYLLVQYDAKFEQFHPNKDRLFRVVSHISFTDLEIDNSGVPFPTGAAIRKEIPQVAVVSQFITDNNRKVSIPNGTDNPLTFKKQKGIIFADSLYFTLFHYEFVAGSNITSLQQPHQTVLTEERAAIYFPGLEPSQILGREIVYTDSIRTTVTGIVKTLSPFTDLRFEEFISLGTVLSTGLKRQYPIDYWGAINSNCQLFVQLAPGQSAHNVEKQLVNLREKYRDRKAEEPKDATTHSLQPITDIHFNPNYDAYGSRKASRQQEAALLAIAGFLLLLGAINYINLSTAQASERAKEIGIRKTLGGNKWQIRLQFLLETLVLTFGAMLLALVLTPWLLRNFNEFVPSALTGYSLLQPNVFVFLLIVLLVVSFLAGYYPAILLSKMKPVKVLKQKSGFSAGTAGNAWLRKGLTVVQFGIAQFLLLATLIVSKQVYFSLNKDLGYKKEAILNLNLPWNFHAEKEDNTRFVLVNKLNQLPGIEKISLAGDAPASGSTSTTDMEYLANGIKKTSNIEIKRADSNFFNLFGMSLLAGRTLQNSDTAREYVINETFARLMGFEHPEDAIGVQINPANPKPVVGVVKDFHPRSTHEIIKPLAFLNELKYCYSLHLALSSGPGQSKNWPETIKKIEQSFKSLYPEEDFRYQFFDQSLSELYQSEQHTLLLLKWSSGLCMFISALGLLGLVIYATNSRTKEIGIRKVLGASVTHLVFLLSKDFVRLVLIAFFIATPITVIVMHNWLGQYAYKTDISWWLFALSAAIMLLLSVITLGFRTLRAAKENPILNLRSE